MPVTRDELKYRVAFAAVRGMGVDLAGKLLEVVHDEAAFFAMSERELRAVTGGHSKIYSDYYRRRQLERAERELEFIEEKRIGTRYYTDESYPSRLREAPDGPLMLYSSGSCDLNAKHVVSIVGTRHATAYGTNFCDALLRDLAAVVPDLVVVSGLAYGIDIAAHRAAMRHGLKTVAVMPGGLNRIYPANHRNDAVAICRSGGAVVTDYLSSDEVHRGNFLARNRIIAALSDCTIVVESAASGGALVTASLAASYDREVMALPGRVSDEYSTGCNRLIRNHQAGVITGADDLLKLMNWDVERRTQGKQLELFPTLSPEEQAVVDVLRRGGDMHINDIAATLSLPVYRIMSTVVALDCRGIVLALPGTRYTMAVR